jgi:DNA-directed RNA polymerase subunit H
MATYGLIDILYRSRITLLNMLEKNGYNVKPYRRFSPKEIEEMVKANTLGDALRMDLVRERGDGPEKCLVLYKLEKQQKANKFTELLRSIFEQDDVPESKKYDFTKSEVIMVLDEPIVEAFHIAAANQWKRKYRIRFFEAAHIVHDPSSFAIVPKHEKLPADEVESVLKEVYLKNTKADKNLLPIIRFHEDPQARWLGLVPGDIVKITRPSPMSGEYVIYRVCAV